MINTTAIIFFLFLYPAASELESALWDLLRKKMANMQNLADVGQFLENGRVHLTPII